MGAERWGPGDERDPCDDTGPIPALPHGDLDRDDDLKDSGEGDEAEPDDEDIAPAAFDELAAELEGAGDEGGDERTGAQALGPATAAEPPGGTTRVDPLAETGDPDALPPADARETARVPEAVTAAAETDRVAPVAPDTTAAVAGLPSGTPPSEAPTQPLIAGAVAALVVDTPEQDASGPRGPDGETPGGRSAPPAAGRAPTPASPAVRALTALAVALPLLFVLLLLALGVPQTAFRRWSGRDRLEPNDAFARARPLPAGTTEDLSCGGADVDWFELEVPAGQAVVVEVTPPPAGAGGASLHTLDGQRVAVAGRGDTRLVHAATGAEPTTLRLCVWGARPDYGVSVAFVPLGARFEPNDVPPGAAPLPPGRARGVSCNGEDWYRVTIPAYHAARARLERAAAGLTLGWSSDGVAPTTSGRDVGARAAPLDRVALLRVAGTGAYDLAVELEPAPLAAGLASRLEPGEYPRLVCSAHDEWRVEVGAGQVLEVLLREPRGSFSFGVELLSAAYEAVSAPTSHRVEAGAAVTHLTYASPRDQELVVRVDGPELEYSIEVRTGAPASVVAPPAPTQPPSVTGARVLGPGIYPDEVMSGEAWVCLDVVAGQQVSVTAEFSALGGDVDLELFDDLGQPVAAGTVTSDGVEVVEHVAARPGRLLLRVSSYAQPQRYSLTIAYDGSAAPRTLAPGAHIGLECPGNAFFSLAAAGGRRLVVELAFASADGDLDVQLLGPGGELLAESTSLEDRERVEYMAAVDETVTLRVFNASNRFDVEVRVED